MDYHEIRKELKENAETVSGVVVVYDHVPDSVIVPCIMIIPSAVPIEFHAAVNGTRNKLNFDVAIVVQHWAPEASQEVLDDLIEATKTAIEAQPTLDGQAQDTVVKVCSSYGPTNVADGLYLAAVLETEVYA